MLKAFNYIHDLLNSTEKTRIVAPSLADEDSNQPKGGIGLDQGRGEMLDGKVFTWVPPRSDLLVMEAMSCDMRWQ